MFKYQDDNKKYVKFISQSIKQNYLTLACLLKGQFYFKDMVKLLFGQ